MHPVNHLQSYRHYKGGTYTRLCVGFLSENRDQAMVVYVSHRKGSVWIRPLEMFCEPVIWPDGVKRERFTPLELAPSPSECPYPDADPGPA
jgi:hypothetical protein